MFAVTILLVCLCGSSIATSFRFVNGNPRQDAEMQSVLQVAARLTKLLDVTLPDSLDVTIVDTQEQFDSLVGGRMPDWGAGAAVPERNLIALRRSMMSQYPGSLANLLQHELAHIALHRRVDGNRIPRFIDEGFASWFAGEWRLLISPPSGSGTAH